MSTATVSRPQSVEHITVFSIGKYGVRIGEKDWFGVNEPLTPQSFETGKAYKVSVVTSKTGKKYISEILGVAEVAPTQEVPKATAPVAQTQKASAPVETAKATAPKLDEKSIQIVRQGLYQAALHSPVLSQFVTGNKVEEYLKLVRTVAEAGISFVAER